MAKKKPKSKATTSANVFPVDTINQQQDQQESQPCPSSVMANVCRLCEKKDGPFLNIFDADKSTAKKIEDLMPFGISENDELPQKICFRCSAKVEELHEFVQKCITTQKNLYCAIKKKFPLISKKSHRLVWEEKLNKSNVTNDDICDIVIKKAMKGIKDKGITSKTVSEANSAKVVITRLADDITNKIEDTGSKKSTGEQNKITNRVVSGHKQNLDNCEKKFPTRSSRARIIEPLLEGLELPVKKVVKDKKVQENKIAEEPKLDDTRPVANLEEPKPTNSNRNNLEKNDEPKVFDIMKHVSKIKVCGVGTLFQCHLCNKNFLQIDVVLSHWCAKNGAAKQDFSRKLAPPELPKVPNIKYINTNKSNSTNQSEEGHKNMANTAEDKNENVIESSNDSQKRPKPKIGPASKVNKIKQTSAEQFPKVGMIVKPILPKPSQIKKDAEPAQDPVLDSMAEAAPKPSLNMQYKLVQGPNNTYTLVQSPESNKTSVTAEISNKRKSSENIDKLVESQSKIPRWENLPDSKGVDLERQQDQSTVIQKIPYPVGLIKTSYKGPAATSVQGPTPFATTAEKKKAYTIIQSKHPSKLLISTIPQPQPQPSVLEPAKKRQKKVMLPKESIQPYSVTQEDNLDSHPKDTSFFTFVNVDPLLSPMYVLPTDSLAQEAQQANARNVREPDDEQYKCSLCNNKFTRKQMLIDHMHSHLPQTRTRGKRF